MWRLIYFIPVWIFVFIIGLIAWALGFIMIPLACICKAYVKVGNNETKPDDGATYHFTWSLMFPWDNYTTDGICCRNYYESPFKKYGYLDMIVTTFVWSAIRNPINNLKRVLSPKYNFNKLQWVSSIPFGYKYPEPCWYLIWQGPFGGYYKSFMLRGVHYYILIGYKFRNYRFERDIPESQKNGVGFTFRIIPKVVK